MKRTVFNRNRHKQLQEELDRIVPVIRDQYRPEKIIVFGSFVRGETREWSDLDVAVVKATNRRFIDRLKDVAILVNTKVGTDFLVYTPQEFEEMSKDNYFVRDEIVAKGKVIYDKYKTISG